MPARVTLTTSSGQQFDFEERTTALVGKEDDCLIRFPKDGQHQTISRHHCLFDINPPDLRIRDLRSRNGTYVNGKLIGKRARGLATEVVRETEFADFRLADGDEIRIGPVTVRVSIFFPATCADCGVEIPPEELTETRSPSGLYRCKACRQAFRTPAGSSPPPDSFATLDPYATRFSDPEILPAACTCARCGQAVTDEAAGHRTGEFVCASCRADPERVVRPLLELARSGRHELVAIEGYTIEKELGRGAMGAVYLAVHERTGARVALKVMLPEVAVGERAREHFLREARNARRLQHRHVVRVHDLGCSEGTFFFTLEYCEEGSLGDLVESKGKPLPPEKATRLIIQALRGLEYAHDVELPEVRLADGSIGAARGLVHRDIKPQNILLAREDDLVIAKLGDYGLSKAFDLAGLSGMSIAGDLGGTPAFMPRQQVTHYRDVKPEVDVWATAATLYYLLTLDCPRNFGKGKDPWRVVLQTDAVPIRQRDRSIPHKLAEVIDQALVDRPRIQIRTATELREALEDAIE
jgi:serine/threonine-protein kinase